MTSIEAADLSAVTGGCRQGAQPPQAQDPAQGDPQQAAPPQGGGGFDWRSLLGGLLGMAQQFLQPPQQQ